MIYSLTQPFTDDPDDWKAYWANSHTPWRRVAEVDSERRAELERIRSTVDPEHDQHGQRPFAGVELTRADVEWLLVTHESEGIAGPIEPLADGQSTRRGVNLAGAVLRAPVDLSGLPLARVNLREADLQGARLDWADLRGTNLGKAQLRGTSLFQSKLQGANLAQADLYEAELGMAELQGASLFEAKLQRASLTRSNLQEAELTSAALQGANLAQAQLQRAHLDRANLQGANLADAALQGADLRRSILDPMTSLERVSLGNLGEESIRVADLHWGGANLAVVDWSQVVHLKDDLVDLPTAVRAYRQLATALRDQGLYDEADRFAHRAQVLRCQSLWREVFGGQLGQLGGAIGLAILWGLAGFGYRPWRPLFWWAVLVTLGTVAFYRVDHGSCLCWPPGLPNQHRIWDSVVESLNACHGRGVFFSKTGHPTVAQGTISAVAAVFGLVIEATFIATFAQRFFGR